MFFKIVALYGSHAEDIGSGEEPAAAARALIGDGRTFQTDLDVIILGIGNCGCSLGEDLSRIGARESGESKTILCGWVSFDAETLFASNVLALGSAMSSLFHCSVAATLIVASMPLFCE